MPIPVLGTTHADFCAHDIELVATPDVADMGDYEHATGVAINALLATRESLPPAVLIPHHAPFAFGFKTLDSTENALILEEVAKNSYLSLALNGQAKAPEYLIRKAYNRKHGADAYYGQESGGGVMEGGGVVLSALLVCDSHVFRVVKLRFRYFLCHCER